MNEHQNLSPPEKLAAIEHDTASSGFSMASDHLTGALLRTLVATKPASRVLELGTGTGLASCWMLDGMDDSSTLITVENETAYIEIARRHLGDDPRIQFFLEDGSDFLRNRTTQKFDFIFADTWPGKYYDLDEALNLLKTGGLYVIDDMLPQDNWPDDHPPKVADLISSLAQNSNLNITKLAWSTGIIIAVKR